MGRLGRSLLTCAALACVAAAPAKQAAGARDPDNPSCPGDPAWGPLKIMTITPADRGGKRVLILEGVVEDTLPAHALHECCTLFGDILKSAF